MYQVTVGQIIKAKDFGLSEFDYIIGEVTYTSSDGIIECILINRIMDNKDVTGEYDDGYFSTVQNGCTMQDKIMGPRISSIGIKHYEH